MRDYILKTNRLTLDATIYDGHTVIAASRPGAMHLATGDDAHLSMNKDAVVTHSDIVTNENKKYLHEGNLGSVHAVMGTANTAKADTYGAGLVREGAPYEEGDAHMFLSKNGQWAIPNSQYTGAVYENFLSLNDTPNNYTLKHGQYLKVDQDKLTFVDLVDDVAGMQFQQLNTVAIHVTSDENSKFQIETCDDCDLSKSIDITNQIPMVRFKYKEGDGKEKLGFLAQSVEKCYQQAVSQGEQYKQVDFTQMLALCMANVKCLINQVGALNKRVSNLDEGISKLLEKSVDDV